ncbi:MAG: hypothetical protein QM831_17400 [Kofleriaceae bacterium]
MKKLIAVGLVAAVAAGGWKLTHRSATDDGGTKVTDRLWIDHMPKNDRDLHDAFLVLTKNPRGKKMNIGVIQRSSAWTGQFNVFKHEVSGNQLKLTFPQNGHSVTVKTEVKRCKEGQFDLCLDITNQRGNTMHFYSNSKWTIGSEADARAIEQQLLSDVPAAPADYVPSTTNEFQLDQ